MRSMVFVVMVAASLIGCGGSGSGGGGGEGGEFGGGGTGGSTGGGGTGGHGGTLQTPQTPLPAEMVGTWAIMSSGPTISGRSELELFADGLYTQSTLIESTTCFFAHETGTVAVAGDSLTIYARTLVTSGSCDPADEPTAAEPPAPEHNTWTVFHDAEWDITYLRLDDGEGPVDWMKE